MGTRELRKRKNWQGASGGKAAVAESNFYDLFTEEFKGTDFRVRAKPQEFRDIYSKVVLSNDMLKAIYNPPETYRHGIVPDYAIDNLKTKKTLYAEVKRQDGWVEGKPRSAGRGNAHERLGKFFTPGLTKIMRERGRLGPDVLPFWVVFQGDIARDPKRVREVHCWFGDDYRAHLFFWHDPKNVKAPINHFNRKLKRLLL
jgi:Type II restriction enzyme MunI